ncbi:MAG TPA: LamG-like jellyroll fold domain-containing protein [Candidatus Acidoferrales bacterium]|nr:LamG-like jellyroll fold domain-containing protein [Candidatus Acidoferrales bacterium]
MKAFDQRANRKLMWWFVALICFLPFTGIAQDDTNDFSWLKLIPPGCCLDSWSFDETNLYTDFGFAPLSFTNIEQVPDWDGEALQVDSTNAAWLAYGIVEDAAGYGEWTNLTLDTGTIEFWFMPNWQSDDTNFFGAGPGDFGRLIEAGAWVTNAESDWWSIYMNPSGTGIYFSSGTNGVRTNYLNAPISWDGNTWVMIDLTYSPTDTALYFDGQLAATGDGVRYVPSGDILTKGFAIGSDIATGMQQAHGQFDDLVTYNYQLNADEIADDYAETYPVLPGTFHAMDDGSLIPPGGTNDDGGGGYGGGGYTLENYGTNLWVALLGMTNDTLSLLETNTMSDVLYELQGCTNLASPIWVSFGFVTGSELTNCTPAVAPVENNGATFYRVRSWQGVDGIPFWWFLTYLGQDTNVSGEMFAPSGDGWTLLQCYQNGLNPTNWVTPPAPQGLTITSFSSTNNTATLSWMLSAGPVLGYVVQTANGTNILGSGVNYYTDNSSSSSATYSIQAIYGGGLSAWSPSVSVEDFLAQQGSGSGPLSLQNVAFADFVPGPGGVTYLALGGVPTNAVTVQVEYIDIFRIGSTITYDVPANAITNGLYQVPTSWSSPSAFDEGNDYAYNAGVSYQQSRHR